MLPGPAFNHEPPEYTSKVTFASLCLLSSWDHRCAHHIAFDGLVRIVLIKFQEEGKIFGVGEEGRKPKQVTSTLRVLDNEGKNLAFSRRKGR
jgi:hypothetical protein